MNTLKRTIFGPLLMVLLACHPETYDVVQLDSREVFEEELKELNRPLQLQKTSFQQCLKDLCGPGDTLRNREVGAIRASETMDLSELENTDWGREITQKIDAYYDRYEILDFIIKVLDLEQSLLEIVASSAVHIEGLPSHGLLGSAVIMEGLSNYANGNKARHRQLLSAVERLAKTSWYRAEKLSLEEFLRLKYGEMPFLQALLLYIDDVENLKSRDLENTGGFVFKQSGIPANLEALKIKAQNGQIAEHEIRALLEPASNLFLFEVFLDYQDRYGEEVAGELREELKVWLEKKTTDEKQDLVDKIMNKDFNNEVASGLASREFSKRRCLRTFHQRSTHYPTQNAIDQFKDFPLQVQRELIQKVSYHPGFSEEAQSLLNQEIGGFHFEFPLSQETYRSTFLQLFDSQLESSRKNSAQLFDMEGQDLAIYFLISQMTGLGYDENESNIFQEGVAGLCDEILEESLNSQTLLGTEIIKIGYSMIYTTPAYARQVLYHEMGHQFKELLEGLNHNLRQSFEESKSCLKDRQDKISGRGEFYLGEDFADLVVATFLEDTSSRPVFCNFFVQDKGEFYNPDAHVWTMSGAYFRTRMSDPSLFNSDVEDDHSSYLLRALFNSVDRGMGLPASCQTALEDAGHGDFQEWQCSLF